MHLATRIAYRLHGQGRERVETLGEILAWARSDEVRMYAFGEMEERLRERGELPQLLDEYEYEGDVNDVSKQHEEAAFDLDRDYQKVTLEDLGALLDDPAVLIWHRPRMSNADFRAMREYLGLPAQWVADRFEVNARTVQKWDSGEARIPEGISAHMEALESFTADAVADFVFDLKERGEMVFQIPQTRDDRDAMTRFSDMPLDWWRMVGARVRTESGAVLDWL